MDPLRHVKFFAAVKHVGQEYGSGLPYTHHLAAVEQVLRRFGYDEPEMLEASWLHDSVEDTNTKLRDIVEMFGERVAELVGAVTNEPGANRKVRGALTYPKIRSVKGATCLKLADRIANVEYGGSTSMYAKDYDDFKRALYTKGEYEEMWARLDRLLCGKCKGTGKVIGDCGDSPNVSCPVCVKK